MSVTYTCKNKGGRYRLIGLATAAGLMKGHLPLVVYESLDTGELYYRTQDDFSNRMEPMVEAGACGGCASCQGKCQSLQSIAQPTTISEPVKDPQEPLASIQIPRTLS